MSHSRHHEPPVLNILRIIGIVFLLGLVHIASIMAVSNFDQTYLPDDEYEGDPAWNRTWSVMAMIIAVVLITLSSWIILLLADLSRLRKMRVRFDRDMNNKIMMTMPDMIFLGLLIASVGGPLLLLLLLYVKAFLFFLS